MSRKSPSSSGSDAAGSPPPEPRHGALVRVAAARHQAEAEMLQGLLVAQGIPTILRRTAGFDVPDFLAAGPRDVLVREGDVGLARDVLGVPEPEPEPEREPGAPPSTRGHRRHAARLLVALAGGGLAAAALAWALLGLSA